MEPWVVVILALLAVLILGGFSAALLPALRSNRFWSGPKADDSIESKAVRLHELVHRNEKELDEPRQAEEGDGDRIR
jgi:hypothetical protein